MKWIREVCKEIIYYYDIWYVVCFVIKKFLVVSKEKGCEVIKEWLKGICWYFYWSVIFIKLGFSNFILVKWKLFF